MWSAVIQVWQLPASFAALIVAVLAIATVPIALVIRTWLKCRADNRRALNERAQAQTATYEAETLRLVLLREQARLDKIADTHIELAKLELLRERGTADGSEFRLIETPPDSGSVNQAA
jgi:hypothetical protein